jgi:hypothetical protein
VLTVACLAAFLALGAAGAQAAPFIAPFAPNPPAIATTVPANGDVNPYGIVTVPSSVGSLQRGNLLISNFNNSANLQGTGTTIVQIPPGGNDGNPGRVGVCADRSEHAARVVPGRRRSGHDHRAGLDHCAVGHPLRFRDRGGRTGRCASPIRKATGSQRSRARRSVNPQNAAAGSPCRRTTI